MIKIRCWSKIRATTSIGLPAEGTDPQDPFWMIVLQPDLPVFTRRPRVLDVLSRQPVPER